MLSFRFTFPIEVRFADLDAIGHVNNATYLTYLESARIAWWLHTTRRTGLAALDMILARVELDFRRPVVFGEALEVGVRCALIKRSSFLLEQRVALRGGGEVVAEARKICVYFDYATQRTQPLPEPIRALLRAQDPDVCESA